MKKRLICWLVLLALVMVPIGALAENSEMLRYKNTKRIHAQLLFEDNNAICIGNLPPLKCDSCSLTVTLYKQNGTQWTKVASWSDNSTNETKVYIEKTKTVSHGTYKVVAEGNVDGETSRYETAAKTY